MMPVNFALKVENVVVLHCRWDDVEDLFAPICRGIVIHTLKKPWNLNKDPGVGWHLSTLTLSQLLRASRPRFSTTPRAPGTRTLHFPRNHTHDRWPCPKPVCHIGGAASGAKCSPFLTPSRTSAIVSGLSLGYFYVSFTEDRVIREGERPTEKTLP